MKLSNTRRRIQYALAALYSHVSTRSYCPWCRHSEGKIVGANKFVFLARKCEHCGLIYRLPIHLRDQFYETDYHLYSDWYREYHSGDLSQQLQQGFRGSHWDYYDKLSLIKAVKPTGSVLDFGAGSGIISWQMQQLGYKVDIFEISTSLQQISRDLLCLNHVAPSEMPDESYDIIFTHHVLEHLSDLRGTFALFERLLRSDGLLVSFVPNAASKHLNNSAGVLDSAHINALTAEFFRLNLQQIGFVGQCFSTPYAFLPRGEDSIITQQAIGIELALFAWKCNTAIPHELADWPFKLPTLTYSERAQAGW